jgi:hypothetical protein
MHVTPRKDMLIDPTSSGNPSSPEQKVAAHTNKQGDGDTATGSQTKLYVYYGQYHTCPLTSCKTQVRIYPYRQ